MFIGRFALGYAAKRWAPRLSLGVLFAAAIFADLLWPVLVALGIEHVRIVPGITASTPLEFISYPYSHSLLTLTLLGALFASLARLCASRFHLRARRFGGQAGAAGSAPVAPLAPMAPIAPGIIVLLLVVSHWVLDVVTAVPAMPLYPIGPKFGRGWWNSVPGTRAVETALFAIGVWMCARATKAREAIGRWAFVGISSFLFVGFVVNAAG